jgi:hypothetical protein
MKIKFVDISHHRYKLCSELWHVDGNNTFLMTSSHSIILAKKKKNNLGRKGNMSSYRKSLKYVV